MVGSIDSLHVQVDPSAVFQQNLPPNKFMPRTLQYKRKITIRTVNEQMISIYVHLTKCTRKTIVVNQTVLCTHTSTDWQPISASICYIWWCKTCILRLHIHTYLVHSADENKWLTHRIDVFVRVKSIVSPGET